MGEALLDTCWIQAAADTLQLPRFLAGMRGEVAERQRLAGVVPLIRIIGARLANKREQALYRSQMDQYE